MEPRHKRVERLATAMKSVPENLDFKVWIGLSEQQVRLKYADAVLDLVEEMANEPAS